MISTRDYSEARTLPRISVIICTRDRPIDLAELLPTILNQTYLPIEVIIVDDSPIGSTKKVINSFSSKFEFTSCQLKYFRGIDDGLPAARNLGVKISKGDITLFLDDDVLLENEVLHAFAVFLTQHPEALGVQGQRCGAHSNFSKSIKRRIENAIYKVSMSSYLKHNTLGVRRSGASIFPYGYPSTAKIYAQRLDGFCMCYRQEVFDMLSFDTNLKRFGSMEDLDFSYRIYKKNPRSLYAIPQAKVIHKKAEKARLPRKLSVYMTTIYWFYVFFKDIFDGSIRNLIAFLWALIGNLVAQVTGLIVNRKPKIEWWGLIYSLESYAVAFRNLRNIIARRLYFFNKNLNR